jgi:hypothetical protein
MPLPWLQLIDAALGIANFARSRKALPEEAPQDLQIGRGAPGGLEARLAGVVVAALKEAFERDSRRLDFERQQLEAERDPAERALRLELQRQAGDREIGQLRLLAGVAGIAWIATLVLASRLAGGAAPRLALGGGWLLLFGAIAAAFSAHSRVSAALDALANGEGSKAPIRFGGSGTPALWLLMGGLLLCGAAALLS